jgi:hypothetical protein
LTRLKLVGSSAGLLVVNVNAVQRDIRLVASSAGNITFSGNARL